MNQKTPNLFRPASSITTTTTNNNNNYNSNNSNSNNNNNLLLIPTKSWTTFVYQYVFWTYYQNFPSFCLSTGLQWYCADICINIFKEKSVNFMPADLQQQYLKPNDAKFFLVWQFFKVRHFCKWNLSKNGVEQVTIYKNGARVGLEGMFLLMMASYEHVPSHEQELFIKLKQKLLTEFAQLKVYWFDFEHIWL